MVCGMSLTAAAIIAASTPGSTGFWGPEGDLVAALVAIAVAALATTLVDVGSDRQSDRGADAPVRSAAAAGGG